jgi:hypothetical protein
MGVHHELSSIVLRHSPTTFAEWLQFSPPGWAQTARPDQALVRANDAAPDPSTGFLSAYGATDAENDFNTYAETIFTEPARLRDLAGKHSLIGEKLAFVLKTYVRVDPSIDATFRELGFPTLVR